MMAANKSVIFTPYSAGKIAARGLSEADVIACVQNPEQIIAGRVGRKIAQRRIRWRGAVYLLRVVFEEYPDRLEVVTAYCTSEIGRYWEKST